MILPLDRIMSSQKKKTVGGEECLQSIWQFRNGERAVCRMMMMMMLMMMKVTMMTMIMMVMMVIMMMDRVDQNT